MTQVQTTYEDFSEDDFDAAEEDWERKARPTYKYILLALLAGAAGRGWRWEPTARDGLGAYRSPQGQLVSQGRIAAELFRPGSKAIINQITQRFLNGEIGLNDWKGQMINQIKYLQLQGGALASGGWGQLTGQDLQFLHGRYNQQLKFFEKFLDEIATKKQPKNGRLLVRANLYAKTDHGAFIELGREHAKNTGFTLERRVLTPGENCEDCLEYASRGFVEIGTLPVIGDSRCRTNCRCELEFRQAEAPV